jgi:hypothetical protein
MKKVLIGVVILLTLIGGGYGVYRASQPKYIYTKATIMMGVKLMQIDIKGWKIDKYGMIEIEAADGGKLRVYKTNVMFSK